MLNYKMLIPGFLSRFDQYLLLHHPLIWSLRFHFYLFYQAVFSSLILSISYLHPQSLGAFPNYGLLITIFTIINGLILLGYLFISNRFDPRMRIAGPRFLYEWLRNFSYALSGLFATLSVYGCILILNSNTVKVVAPLTYSAFKPMDSTLSDFRNNYKDYAKGFRRFEYYDSLELWHQDTMRLADAEVNRMFQEVANLNVQFGNQKVYSIAELKAISMDSEESLFYPNSNSKSEISLHQLDANFDQLRRSFQIIDRSTRWYAGFLLFCFIFSIVIGILSVLISNYKYFEIRGLIGAILSPAILGIILGIYVAIMAISNNYFYDNGFIELQAFLLIIGILIYVFYANYTTNWKLMLYESLPFLIVTLFLYFRFETMDPWFNCPHLDRADIELSQLEIIQAELECDRLKQMEKIWESILVIAFAFFVIPLYQSGLYRIFYQPKK